MISIAQDDRIRHNSRIFDMVSALTTLYQATLLKDDEFHELANNATEEGVEKLVTLGTYRTLKSNRPNLPIKIYSMFSLIGTPLKRGQFRLKIFKK